MSKRTRKWTLVAALAVVGAGLILGGLALAKTPPPPTPQPPPPPPIPYLVTYLGDLGGGTSNAADINANGDVVGGATMPDKTYHAFLYTHATGMVNLNSVIDPNSGWVLYNAHAVNDLGQVTGVGYLNGVRREYRFTPGTPWGQVEALSIPPGDANALTRGINNFGEICGQTSIGGVVHACYWSSGNAAVPIFPDGRYSDAFGINDAGQVVGHYYDAVKSTYFVSVAEGVVFRAAKARAGTG